MRKPIIKWMGGKTRVLGELQKVLPKRTTFVEPFVGAGSVFLNTNYSRYILSDSNPDLIRLLCVAREQPEELIAASQPLFLDGNTTVKYMERRELFNSGKTMTEVERAAMFLYLMRHGYNGMCRYNSSGGFNVPFGRYPNGVYYPLEEIRDWAKRCAEVEYLEIVCEDFRSVLARTPEDAVIYADPPYIPLSDTAKHAQYHRKEFSQTDHRELAKLLQQQVERGNSVVLSNADTLLTREIYYGFAWRSIEVGRYMGASGAARKTVTELLGVL